MSNAQPKRKPERFRVRAYGPEYFVAERNGSDYCPSMYVSSAPCAAWRTADGPEAAIKAALALREYPKTIWDRMLA